MRHRAVIIIAHAFGVALGVVLYTAEAWVAGALLVVELIAVLLLYDIITGEWKR